MKRFSRKTRSGFTLVELLIVVAIIGVLSTIGVPTFKKMVQKAKKSEAKVALGALYTVESAFYSEYGVYGNNVTGIGYELDGSSSTRIYSTGFPSGAACGNPPIAPTQAAAPGLSQAFPAYFTNASYIYLAGAGTAGCNTAAFVPASGSTFTGTAGGFISQVAGAPADWWSIDQLRNLANTQDGVK